MRSNTHSILLLLLFVLPLVACGDVYADRIANSQREQREFFCPCAAADGVYASEAECLNVVGAAGDAYVACIEPLYEAASESDQATFDCFADEQEVTNACFLPGTCSDDDILDRCVDAADFARCGRFVRATTTAGINACVELLDI